MTTPSTSPALTPQWPALVFQALSATAAQVRTFVTPANADDVPGSQALVLTLATNAIQPIDRPLGRTITCESGTLWLTFDNIRCDVVLEAGQSHRCTANNRLLIMALQGACVRVR